MIGDRGYLVTRGVRDFQRGEGFWKQEQQAVATTKASVLESPKVTTPLGSKRESFFAPEKMVFGVNTDTGDMEASVGEGVNILKRRRGSIFGNDTGSIFGN